MFESDKRDVYIRALQAMGRNEAEAKVLAALLLKGSVTATDIVDHAPLAKASVYTTLDSLTKKGYVIKSGKRPVKYSATQNLAENMKNEMKALFDSLSAQLAEAPYERQKILDTISHVFESNNYDVRKLAEDLLSKKSRYSIRGRRLFDHYAKGEYSIGIALIDQNKADLFQKGDLDLITREYLYATREMDYITSFIFIQDDIKNSKYIHKKLCSISNEAGRYGFLKGTGMAGSPLCVVMTSENIEEKIVATLKEIKQRRVVIDGLRSTLREKIAKIDDLISNTRVVSGYIENMIYGRIPIPWIDKKLNVLAKENMVEPIQNIRMREIRNLNVFSRRYMVKALEVGRYMEHIEKRTYLPSPELLERDIEELEILKSKFDAIKFELDMLFRGLLGYLEAVRSKKGGSRLINPFMFTEPYEKDDYHINQEILENAATELAESIRKGLPQYLNIIKGEAGSGKTHSIKYIYAPILKKEKILSLYIDCPVRVNLIEAIIHDIFREENFPKEAKEIQTYIKGLKKDEISTPRDLALMLDLITKICTDHGYNGVIVVLDELENLIPLQFSEISKDSKGITVPFALEQLKELIELKQHKNLGFIISCRDSVYPIIERIIVNADEFTYAPERFNAKHLEELIDHRYGWWRIKTPIFSKNVLRHIVKKTGKNARDSIKYSRGLFDFAVERDITIINIKTLEKFGDIPIFK